MSRLQSNNCNQNPTDPSCYCLSAGPMNKYKIFDTKTGTYSCCGTINFNLYSPSLPPPLTAAIQDLPQCAGWWYGSSQNFESGNYPGNLPVPGVDFYFPEELVTSDVLPVSYGPSDQDLQLASEQSKLNQIFTLPTNSISENTSTVTCGSGDLYWLKYKNNNPGKPFAITMVCSPPLDNVRSSDIYTSGNWALFKVVCDNPSNNSCTTSAGQIMGSPSNSNIGSSVLTSSSYTGGIPPLPVPSAENHTLLWIILAIVAVIIITGAIIGVVIYYKRKSKPMNIYSSVDKDTTDE